MSRITASRGPRLTKQEKAVAEAKRLAALLAEAVPEHPGELAPPAFIADPRLAPALAAWRELAPQLTKTGRLLRLDRFVFAMLCYWQGEFIASHDDLERKGKWFKVRAVSGGMMPRKNPSLDQLKYAYEQVMALSAKFGLTPLDRIALLKAHKAGHVDDEDGDLFDAPAAAADDETPDDPWVGRLN